jgi:hypothetical protein
MARNSVNTNETPEPVYVFVTTVNVGTDDEFQVVSKTAEEALDCIDGDYKHAIYQFVKEVTITKKVSVNVKEVS